MKANINLPEEVLEKTDKRAKALGLSRSAFITMTLSEKLMQTDIIDNLPKMMQALNKLSETTEKSSQ